jgi:F0F1-type ATP synthase membrane subunit b/b'
MDATFWAFIGLILFLVLVAYLKVPGMMAKALDERADKIRDELAEAKRLREEAQHLLAEYQRKRKEAEAEAASIVAAAEREAAALTALRAEDQTGRDRSRERRSRRRCRPGNRCRRKGFGQEVRRGRAADAVQGLSR